jgi:biopolymer transport protein ExbB
MLLFLTLAAADATNAAAGVASVSHATTPTAGFGPVFWFLILLCGVSFAVILERALLFRREQIDSAQFLAGVRNVLKRDNVLEALSICDATPGPVARMMKSAILARDGGRERVQEAIEEVGLVEVPRLEAHLAFLATIAQIAPLLGLLGTLMGFTGVFRELRRPDAGGFGYAAPGELFDGVMQALYAASLGIGLAIVCYAAYNYLVTRVNTLVLDLERAGSEAVKMVTGDNGASKSSNG